MTSPVPIAPHQLALALVAEGPGGDRVLGYVPSPPMQGRCLALTIAEAGKWSSLGDLTCWVMVRAPALAEQPCRAMRVLGRFCRWEFVGLIAAGGGTP